MENLAKYLDGLVAVYGYYDKRIAEIECDTLERYIARTGAPISAKELDAFKCEALNALEHRKNTVARAIDHIVDRLEERSKEEKQ